MSTADIAPPRALPIRLPMTLGTMLFGSATPENTAHRLLDHFVAAGGDSIDTANAYASWLPGGEGRSECVVGAWLRARANRAEVFLATKGLHPMFPDRRSRVHHLALEQDLAQSLDRLGTDYLDLYWLHRDEPSIPVDEILGWLQPHLKSGTIRAIGASNWTLARLEAAHQAAHRLGLIGFHAVQNGWSYAQLAPLDPTCVATDTSLVAWHTRTGIPLFAYSAQGRGWFAGRSSPAVDLPTNHQRRAVAAAVAARIGATPTQVALAWLMRHPFPVHPVIGATDVSQLDEALGSRALSLSDDDITSLNAAC